MYFVPFNIDAAAACYNNLPTIIILTCNPSSAAADDAAESVDLIIRGMHRLPPLTSADSPMHACNGFFIREFINIEHSESEHNNEPFLRSVDSLAAYLKVGLSDFQGTLSLY